jgi:hypothetical protein
MHSLVHPADLKQLQQRLLAVTAGDRALWGVMNAGEMICHVRGAFLTAMGEIPCDPVEVPMPRAALKALALWSPVPWRQNFETVPTLKRGTPAMQVGLFRDNRQEALAAMERFCRADQSRVDHAFFGTMRLRDWMRWGYLHTDHHLRQFGR